MSNPVRILLIGCPASGKTTVSNAICDLLTSCGINVTLNGKQVKSQRNTVDLSQLTENLKVDIEILTTER